MSEGTVKDWIFNFAYYSAVNDATMQLAYNGQKKSIEENENAKNIVKKYIDTVLDENSETPDLVEVASRINNAISDNDFSFGNIQKLINMTTKYIFVACYTNDSLRKCFENCDCPMDRIMIAKVRKEYREKNRIPRNKPIPGFDFDENGKRLKWSDVSWSKICFEETEDETSIKYYHLFQKMVKELADKDQISRLEYDFKEWNPADSTSNNNEKTGPNSTVNKD